jgi:hypothetical protein
MVRGMSAREYKHVRDMVRDDFGVGKSSVSRGFVRASAADVKALAERRFDSERLAAVVVDGVVYAGKTMAVPLGITEDGTKRILGLRQRATEHAEVCTAIIPALGWRPDNNQPPPMSAGSAVRDLLRITHSARDNRGVACFLAPNIRAIIGRTRRCSPIRFRHDG